MLRSKDKKQSRIDNCLDKAKAAVKSGEFDFARQYSNQALKLDPQNETAQQLLELIPIERARRWSALNRMVQSVLTLVKFYSGNYETTVGVAEALAKSNPNKPFWFKIFGRCCIKTNRLEDSVQAYEKVVEMKPMDAKFLRQLGELYVQAERYKDAVDIFHRLHKIKPTDPEVDKALKNATAQAYAEVGVPEKLTEKRSIEEKQRRDKVREAEEKRVSGIEQLRDKCDEDPSDLRSRTRLARLLMEMQEYEQAAKYLQQASQLAPDDLKVLRQLAEAREKAGQIEGAWEVWNALSQKDPEDLESRERMLNLRLNILANEIQEAPENEALKVEMQNIHDEAGDLKIARLDKQLSEQPQDMNLSIELGAAYRERGMPDEAIHIYQDLAKNPTKAFVAYKLLGDAFGEKSMNKMGIEQYKKALERQPPNPSGVMRSEVKDIYYSLGLLCQLEGKREEAIEAFKPVYEQDIHYKNIRERFETLYNQQ